MTRLTRRAACTGMAMLLLTFGAARTAEKNSRWWRDNLAGPDSSNYVDLDQIRKSNVDELEVAWTYPYAAGGFNPIVVDDLLYVYGRNGSLIALDASTGYAIDLFGLPVRDVLDKVSEEQFHAPGSQLRILMDTEHPLSYGMSAEEVAYFADSPAFQTSPPDARFERRVVATYPENATDILVSGYLKGGEKLEKKAAVVEYKVGKVRVVLIGFRPQHRAQTPATFPFLFNALFWAAER